MDQNKSILYYINLSNCAIPWIPSFKAIFWKYMIKQSYNAKWYQMLILRPRLWQSFKELIWMKTGTLDTGDEIRLRLRNDRFTYTTLMVQKSPTNTWKCMEKPLKQMEYSPYQLVQDFFINRMFIIFQGQSSGILECTWTQSRSALILWWAYNRNQVILAAGPTVGNRKWFIYYHLQIYPTRSNQEQTTNLLPSTKHWPNQKNK